MSRFVLLVTLAVSLVALSLSTGCSSRPAAAQKLFEKGEFEQVIAKYPDLEIARRARAKLADKLLLEGKFEEIARNFADTPAAYRARNEIATKLFNDGKFQAVLDSFPGSPVWNAARDRLIDTLFAAGLYDSAARKFSDAPKVTARKDSLSGLDLTAAKTLRGKAQLAALEAVMRKWPGTTAYKEAARLTQELKAK